MPNDATFEIKAELQEQESAELSFITSKNWNIEDMDPGVCMVDLRFSGMFCLASNKEIDPARPGMVYVDGEATEPPFIPGTMPMFGQMIGFKVRKYLREYNRTYHLRYAGAYGKDGIPISEISFDLKTLPRHTPGENWAEHDDVVLQAARESAVLLKNENKALPLKKNSTVNAFGAGAVVFRPGCLGAGKINPRYLIRVKEGIEKYSSLKLNEELYEYYTNEDNSLPAKEILDRAKEKSDTAVVFISRTSSEAHDNLPVKGKYYLTDEEKSLIEGIRKTFTKVVAVLNVAYPIETEWMRQADAVLLVGLPGMMGGRALAEILEGTVNPSGKLACTWAKDYKDYPSSRNFLTLPDVRRTCPDAKFITTVYEEGLYVGYRYFDTFEKEPAFRFGYGLSYTQFETRETLDRNVVNVFVRNTGKTAGKEVVQIYAKLPDGKLEQPKYRLVAFAKTKELKPEEIQTLQLEITEDRLRSFDKESGVWVIEKGEIQLFLNDEKIGAISAEGKVIKNVKARIPSPVSIKELSKYDEQGSYPTGKETKPYVEDELPLSKSRVWKKEFTELQKSQKRITYPQICENPSLIKEFVAQMSDYELARLTVGGKTGWGVDDIGFAGMLYNKGKMEKYDIPDYYFSDGNNGLNLRDPNIGFPTSATMCASWNEELMYEEGKAIAEEAKAKGMNCILGPAMNIQRNILCGRHTEYFSEDPLLAGRMAGWQCKGLEENGVSGCLKHFYGNNAETMRNCNHSIMSERVARELYLAAFEYAFAVRMPDTVMTGYNAANGMYCSNDPVLLQGILREEMGFDGYVMTDWNGYGDQGMIGLVEAGVSWIAPGSEDDTLVTPIVGALENGTLSRAQLQHNLVDLITVCLKNS